jgi:hypothetical protein
MKFGSMTLRLPHAILGLAILASVVGVIVCGKIIAPVGNGNSADFWVSACGVDLRPGAKEKDILDGTCLPRNGYYIYYYQGLDRQLIFKVPREVAVADFPEVIRRVRELSLGKVVAWRVQRAAAALAALKATNALTPEQFLYGIHQQMLKYVEENSSEGIYRGVAAEETEFDGQWARAQRYWLNQILEILFFSGLSWFALWPWLRRSAPWRWAFHLGMLPLLLFLPYYCGYAAWTFTSVGPSGGALYPFVIEWFRGFPMWTSFDSEVLKHIPKFLEPISQTPGIVPDDFAGAGLGPFECILIGLLIGGIAAATIHFLHKRNSETGH